MYKLLLIHRYLRRKLAPLFAAVAVALCTAMLIVVISVMGGFLDMMKDTAKKLTGDVVIQSGSLSGFEGYEELIERLEADEAVALATPTIEAPALIKIADQSNPIQVIGIRPGDYARIVEYEDTLLWTGDDFADILPKGRLAPEVIEEFRGQTDLHQAGMTLTQPYGYERAFFPRSVDGQPRPAGVLGVAANPYQRRDRNGKYHFEDSITNIFITRDIANPVSLSFLSFSPDGEVLDAKGVTLPIVNEFQSGYHEMDKAVLFVPFDWLQDTLDMQAATEYTDFDPETGLGGDPVERPGRAGGIIVKAAPGYTSVEVQARAQVITTRFLEERGKHPRSLRVLTWEEVHGTLLGAVQNEKGLVTFLFAFIGMVAVVMVASTFYMIVLEKTRDIGVLRAIGASSAGVLNLFLGYGLAIGLIGTSAGVWLAWFTVTNLNNLQNALNKRMGTLIGVVILALVLATAIAAVVGFLRRKRDFSLGNGVLLFILAAVGLLAMAYYAFPKIRLPGISNLDKAADPNSTFSWQMWDPQLYFFETIPVSFDPVEVAFIAGGAVLASVLGATVPAIIAARLNPIDALRYE